MKLRMNLTLALVIGLIATALCQQRNLPEFTNNFRISWYPVNGEEYNRGDAFQMGLDIDHDGWGEFVVNDYAWRLFLIFEAQADDKYVEAYSSEADYVWIADFNHDNNLDLLTGVATADGDKWSIYEWDGNNLDGENGHGFRADPLMEVTTPRVTGRIFGCNDLDNDGNLDIITALSGSSDRKTVIHILEVDASTWPSPSVSLVYSSDEIVPCTWYNVRAPGYSDVDNNGFKELLMGMNESRALLVIPCTGNNTYGPDIQVRYSSSMGPAITVSPLVADVNKDEMQEIYFGELDGKLFILESTGDVATSFTLANTHYLTRVIPQWAYAVGNLNMFHNGRVGDHDGDGIPNFYYSAKDCESFVDFEYQSGNIMDSASYAINHTRIIHPGTNEIMHYSWWSMAQGPLGREGEVDMDRDNKREVVADSWDSDGILASGWPCLVVLEAKEEFTTTVKEKRQGALPMEYRLVGSYPNPFNASTRVIYELGMPVEVHLRVYDVSGKLITTLDEGKRAAGRYEFLWNAQSLSSGLYFISLESGDFRQVHRTVLLK